MPLTLLSARLLFSRRKKMARLFAAVLFLIVAAAPAFATPKTEAKAESAAMPAASQQYKAVKDFANRLEHENTLGKVRDNWINCAQLFHKMHLSERKGALGPASLFMAGKTYRRAYDRFKMPQDLDAALHSFLELKDLYPGHALAGEALSEAAACAKMHPGKKSLAGDVSRTIAASSPQGDRSKTASGKLQPQTPEPSTAQPAQAAISQEQPHLAALAPVKYWSSADYCRIVLQPDVPVPFSAKVLDQGNGQDRQLAIDLGQSYVDQTSRQPLLVQSGFLRAVRPGQLNGNTARILLELASLSDYKIFSLPDPFRIVVDIRAASSTDDKAAASLNAVPQIVQSAKRPANEPAQSSVISLTEQKKRNPQSAGMYLAASKGKSRGKLSLAQQLGLGVRKIVIDPGHGGKDPGAMAFGLKEKDVTLAIAKKIAKTLRETYNYEVMLTRTKDVFIPLEERTAIANTQKCDLFISIHTNAHANQGRKGIETYFLNFATDVNAMRVAALENASSTHNIGEMQDILSAMMQNSKTVESTQLAQFVQSNLASGLGSSYKRRNLGVKQAPFYVLIGAEMPAILIETSFITNPEEAKLLQTEQYFEQIAAHLATGIAAYVDHRHTAAVTR